MSWKKFAIRKNKNMADSKETSSSSASSALEEELSSLPDPDVKIILLGDSAVGKSKLVERFLMVRSVQCQHEIYQ